MQFFPRWFRLGAVLASTTVVSLLVAMPAVQAYSPNPSVRYLTQDAATCGAQIRQDASSWVADDNDVECLIAADFDLEYFFFDTGSENLFIELWHQGNFVGQVIFAAYDEILTVSDTRNDDDTFYVWIHGDGPYYAQGSSSTWDTDAFNLNLPDGSPLDILITDDMAGTDVIASTNNNKLPRLWP